MAHERGAQHFRPEINNGMIPPPRGGIRLNAAVQTRPGAVIAPDRPAPPPPVQPRPEPAPQEAPKKPKHNIRNIALTSTALGALAAGAYEIYKHVPAIHQMVDQAFLSHLSGDQLVSTDTTTKPEVKFNPTAISGVTTPDMITILPQKEIDEIYPTAFGKLADSDSDHVISIPQPMSESERTRQIQAGVKTPDLQYEIRKDKGTLQIQYPLDLSQSSDPNAKISFERAYGGFNAVDRIALQGKEYYDWIGFKNVPKGAIIKAPLDGYFVISETNGEKHESQKSTGGIIVFQAPNGNIYRLNIGGVSGNNIFVFTPLLDAPDLVSENNRTPVGTYGIKIQKGQALFQTNTRLDEVGFGILMAVKGKIGAPPEIMTQPFVPTTLELLYDPQENKLIASQN